MEGKVSSLPASASSSSLQMDHDDDKHMLPCRFYAHGYCHKGTRCRFYHPPTPAALRNSIRVPPLPLSFENRRLREVEPQLRRDRVRHPHTSLMRPASGIIPHNVPTPMRPNNHRFTNHVANQIRFPNYVNRQQPRIPFGFGGGYLESATKYGDRDWDDFEFYNRESQENGNGRVPLFVPPQQPLMNCKDASNFEQNTVFKHIRWSDFLAPGQLPPPPVEVPIPKDSDELGYFSALSAATRQLAMASGSRNAQGQGLGDGDASNKLTAKQELQVKVREIALELAKEPAQPRMSLDSFFRNYTFSSQERAALLIAPEDISRIARENKIVHFELDGVRAVANKKQNSSAQISSEQGILMEDSPRNDIVQKSAEALIKRLAEQERINAQIFKELSAKKFTENQDQSQD